MSVGRLIEVTKRFSARRGVLDAAQDAGRAEVGRAGADHPDQPGAAAGQGPGGGVGPVAEPLDGLLTRPRVCALMCGAPLTTRDTVWLETPASRATSASTGDRRPPCGPAAPAAGRRRLAPSSAMPFSMPHRGLVRCHRIATATVCANNLRLSRVGDMTTTSDRALTIGVDFGTLSGRAVVVRVADGAELGSAVHAYEHGVLDDALPGTGASLPPDWALQVPDDYRAVLRTAVPAAIEAAGVDPADVIGIATDFTACTMVPTTADGTPLCEQPAYADRPHAYVKLWKHHAAQGQADRINAAGRAARRVVAAPLRRLHLLASGSSPRGCRSSRRTPRSTRPWTHWVEAADWIVWQLTGEYTRNACTAGYKGIYQDGAVSVPGLPGRAQPGVRRLRHREGRLADHRARRPGRRAVRARPRPGPACPRASRSPPATSTPTSPARPLGRSTRASCWRSWAPRPAT